MNVTAWVEFISSHVASLPSHSMCPWQKPLFHSIANIALCHIISCTNMLSLTDRISYKKKIESYL